MSRSLEGVLIKKAHQSQKFTHEQVQEFAACADPDTFCGLRAYAGTRKVEKS